MTDSRDSLILKTFMMASVLSEDAAKTSEELGTGPGVAIAALVTAALGLACITHKDGPERGVGAVQEILDRMAPKIVREAKGSCE